MKFSHGPCPVFIGCIYSLILRLKKYWTLLILFGNIGTDLLIKQKYSFFCFQHWSLMGSPSTVLCHVTNHLFKTFPLNENFCKEFERNKLWQLWKQPALDLVAETMTYFWPKMLFSFSYLKHFFFSSYKQGKYDSLAIFIEIVSGYLLGYELDNLIWFLTNIPLRFQ